MKVDPEHDFERMHLEGPVARTALNALKEQERRLEIEEHEERERRIEKIAKRWLAKFDARLEEVYVLKDDGSEVEFCLEGHGANPKVVARIHTDYQGDTLSFHLRVKYTPFEHLLKHPFEDLLYSTKRGPTYLVNFFASPVGLGEALDRDWKRLRIAGWRGDRVVLP